MKYEVKFIACYDNGWGFGYIEAPDWFWGRGSAELGLRFSSQGDSLNVVLGICLELCLPDDVMEVPASYIEAIKDVVKQELTKTTP